MTRAVVGRIGIVCAGWLWLATSLPAPAWASPQEPQPGAAAPAAGEKPPAAPAQPAGQETPEQVKIHEEIDVTGRASDLVGIADSATEGVTGRADLEKRPISRPGELLETVPGVIITQHSGSGKANQYFARGFNLDHGTDFRVTVDGIQVNMPSHGHGQGYSDLNFLIPELVDSIQYRKGPYEAGDGDFSAAGATDIEYVNSLPRSLVAATPGMEGRAGPAGGPASSSPTSTARPTASPWTPISPTREPASRTSIRWGTTSPERSRGCSRPA